MHTLCMLILTMCSYLNNTVFVSTLPPYQWCLFITQGCVQVLKSGGYIKVFKSSKLVIFNFYVQIIPREFLIDATYVHMYVLHKVAGNLRLSIFIDVDILVLISEL